MTTLRAVAVIPARGGSKGVPEKNLQLVTGQTLIARAVSTCRAAQRVSEIVVSTEDERIAAEARAAGATIVDRPTSLATDDASSEDVVLHALDEIRQDGIHEEVVALIQCTSPFLLPEHIDGTITLLETDAYDCTFSAMRFNRYLWSVGKNSAEAIGHDLGRRLPRQKSPARWLETGGVYAMKTLGFRQARNRFFGRIGMFEVSSLRSLEIDDLDDLALAQLLGPVMDNQSVLGLQST